jgi:hypothetical protein
MTMTLSMKGFKTLKKNMISFKLTIKMINSSMKKH